MYTIQQVERAAIAIFNEADGEPDKDCQARMRAITLLYARMLTGKVDKLDETTLDNASRLPLSHYVP
jgi:hypothetical protein